MMVISCRLCLGVCPDDIPGFLSITDVLTKLQELGIRSLMVEGGATVIASFLKSVSHPSGIPKPLVDTLIITVAPTMVGDQGIAYTQDQVCQGFVFCMGLYIQDGLCRSRI